MKIYLPLFLMLIVTSFTSNAGNTLKEQCLYANGIYVETASIVGINNTAHVNDKTGFNIAVKYRDTTHWYTVDAASKGHVAQLAELAMLTNNPVNTCEDFKATLLYGIELKKW
jgi:hypothetical protein